MMEQNDLVNNSMPSINGYQRSRQIAREAKMNNKISHQQSPDELLDKLINILRRKPVAEEYPSLIEKLNVLATEGNAGAARILAILHMRGRGVPKSLELGFQWLHRSSELGDVSAQFYLARHYENGWGVEADISQVFQCYLKAAENGHLFSQVIVGLDYAIGYCTTQSDELSSRWFKIAAEGGDIYSQFEIGHRYQYGVGITQSDEEALHWFRLAAERGDDKAQVELASCYSKGRGVPQSDQEAFRWMSLAADQGNTDAINKLIKCYSIGSGVEKSSEMVFYWIEKNAEIGDPPCQFLIGLGYLIEDPYLHFFQEKIILGDFISNDLSFNMDNFGIFVGEIFFLVGIEEDEAMNAFNSFYPSIAMKYLKGSLNGLPDVDLLKNIILEWESNFMKLLIPGQNVDREEKTALQIDEKARVWISRAAEQDYEPAKAILELLDLLDNNNLFSRTDYESKNEEPISVWAIHHTPPAVPLILQEAGVRIIKRAAEFGHAGSQCALGELYETGRWLNKSADESFKWYLLAAEQGYARATLNLVRGLKDNHLEQEKTFQLLHLADHPGSWQFDVKKALGDLYLTSKNYDLALEYYLEAPCVSYAAALLIEELDLVSNPDNVKALELLKNESGIGDLIAGLLLNTYDSNNRLRNSVESLYPLVLEKKEIPLPNAPGFFDWTVSKLTELEAYHENENMTPFAKLKADYPQFGTNKHAHSRDYELEKVVIKVNPNNNVLSTLLLAYLETGKDRKKVEQHLKLAYKNKDAVATFLLNEYFPPTSVDRQMLLESVIDRGIKDHIYPKNGERLSHSQFASKSAGYSPKFLGRLLNDAQQARNEMLHLREVETQRKLAQAELEKREAMENMMALFAHKFRGPVDSILFNTSHQHDERVYVDAARTMNGLLDIFSVVSTSPDKLLGSLKDDTNGEGTPAEVLLHSTKLALVQLLSLRNRRRMSPYYLAYAKKQGNAPEELRLSEWTKEKLWQDMEKSLQTCWEQEVGAMIVTGSHDEVNEWMSIHLLPIQIEGFAKSETRFAQYGPKASLLTVIFTEILVNAIKHSTPAAVDPIQLTWSEGEVDTIFSCINPSTKESRTREASKGSGRGHKFLGLITDHIQGRFNANVFNDVSSVSMEIPSSAVKG